jgi:hypothetical protein
MSLPAGLSHDAVRAGLLGIVATALGATASAADPSQGREGPVPVRFVDVAANAGIEFHHDNAASPEKFLIETMGSGAAWLDFDNDGFLDAYLANSAATEVYKPSKPLRAALYRNNGDGTFRDVTGKTGVAAENVFGMGVAAGDYDNDGDPDLFVAGYGRSILYRNENGASFVDVTAQAGVSNPRKWASSAAWFDYDNDGRLDLVIVNYLDWSPDNNLFCGEQRPGYRSYCHPNKYHGQPTTLYRNRGDGTFEDVSEKSGIGRPAGNGLGVVCFDYDDDGWMDVFVANDSMENFLFHNRGDGRFEEVGLPAGVAYGDNGEAEAGMGTDAADIDGDGRLDLYLTHLDFEFDRFYRNAGDGVFEDSTFRAKLGYDTFHTSGFGVRFVDYDNDGLRDIFTVNGHVLDNIQLYHAETAYAEPKIVFRNAGGTFENATGMLGPDLERARVSRAAAFGDYDNDGDVDVLVSNSGQAAELLRNDGGNANHWLQVHLIGTASNRDGVGARVKVVAGDLVQYDQRKGGLSYQSAHDPRLHFGLGIRTQVDRIEVRWPSGKSDKIENIEASQTIAIQEGAGRVPSRFQMTKRNESRAAP